MSDRDVRNETVSVSRRNFLGIATASGLTLLGYLRFGPGAAVAQGENQPAPMTLSPMQMPERLLHLDGISAKTVQEHWKLYEGYVKKANEILTRLQTVDRTKANQTFSDLRELKVEYTFALGGVRNHELYFVHLGGKGGPAEGQVADLIKRDFGSFESWAADLKATGIAARGWVWLAYDRNSRRLFNYLGDAQNTYPIWDATPILALDTYEHAYWLDYQTNRGAYIDAFLRNIDWKVVNDRLKQAMSG